MAASSLMLSHFLSTIEDGHRHWYIVTGLQVEKYGS
jgi:hypothetical protein